MQKLLEKKNKKTKKRKSPPPSTGLTGPAGHRAPPHGPRPTSTSRPSSPHRAPFLFPWCAPLQGRRPRRTTSPSTRRIRSTPPLDASTSSPPTSTHAPNPLALSASPSPTPSFWRGGRRGRRRASPVLAATGGPAPADPVGELRQARLLRLAPSAGTGKHRSRRSSSSPSPAAVYLLRLRRRLCCY